MNWTINDIKKYLKENDISAIYHSPDCFEIGLFVSQNKLSMIGKIEGWHLRDGNTHIDKNISEKEKGRMENWDKHIEAVCKELKQFKITSTQ